MKWRSIPCVLGLFLCSAALHGQALPTATRSGVLQAGVTYSNANSDQASKRIGGISAYGTFDLYKGFGLEADVRLLQFWTPQDYAERTYLAGIRYSRHYGRYQPYVKGLGGIGVGYAQQPYANLLYRNGNEHFGAYAIGGGLDVHLSHNINLRAIDFEQQLWPGFDPHGLSPSVLSIGAAYRFR